MAKRKRPPTVMAPLPVRIARLHAKLALSVLIGIIVAGFLSLVSGMTWLTQILTGWDVGVAAYLIFTYAMMWRTDVDRIVKRAAEQDEGAAFILILSIVATFASLAAIVYALGISEQAPTKGVDAAVVMAIATILLSWFFVHTIFSLHYAHEYYGARGDGKIGGIEFPHDPKPDYRDFLYFALVIGMTSQVSDTDISSKVIRRFVAVHGVLSFFFNLVVLALTVNMVSNLIKPG
jgi:uncharacterized membrane protein